MMDGFEWTPTWPDPPPNEIRFPAFSSVFTGLTPALPSGNMSVTLTPVQARESLTILQFPTLANNYTLIVDFNDDIEIGNAIYEALQTITYPPGPPISTTASGLAYSRPSQTFNGTVTISNTSSSSVDGPFQIIFSSLTFGVTLANATGTHSGSPYITVPAVTSLAPGQSATISVQFKNPSNAKINFTPTVYIGSLNN
jgi:hypothetical protein